MLVRSRGDTAGVVVGIDGDDAVDPIGQIGGGGEGEDGSHRLAEQCDIAQVELRDESLDGGA